ncbi:MAG TPA: DinB family protein [Acidiphilium sp.]
MIDAGFVRTMAAYNAEMNRRWYEAAGRLPAAARSEDIGLFWKSIEGTLNHLLWADRMWMSRFAGWDRPAGELAGSGSPIADFTELTVARFEMDRKLIAWAGTLDDAALAGDLTWHSGVMKCDITKPRALLLVHMFNHQTHHRGQAHAGLTKFGVDPGITDLPFLEL